MPLDLTLAKARANSVHLATTTGVARRHGRKAVLLYLATNKEIATSWMEVVCHPRNGFSVQKVFSRKPGRTGEYYGVYGPAR